MICFLLFSCACMASEGYKVYNYKSHPPINPNEEAIVFILDYSNSMNERIDGNRKIDILKESMKNALSKTNNKTPVGIRIYGHRLGVTQFDACKASSNIETINIHNNYVILDKLSKYRPRGMTPITYSLKEAITKDFPQNNKSKHIILVTDGGENCDESPCEYSIQLVKHRRDVRIDVIAINVNSPEDIDQLICTANVTGGKFFFADTKIKLEKSFDNVIQSNKQVGAKIITH